MNKWDETLDRKALLRIDEVMQLLGIKSRNTIKSMVANGELQAHYRNGKRRGMTIFSKSVKDFLSKGANNVNDDE